MNTQTLMMVKKLIQERMRRRTSEQSEQVEENLIDAVCLDCINFRLTLEAQRAVLMKAAEIAPEVTDEFLRLVEDELTEQPEQNDDHEA